MSEQSKSIGEMIPLAAVTIAQNVRTTTGLDPASIAELSKTLKKDGQLQPIFVARLDDGYAVIAGQRRTLAARLLGWTEIAAIVTDSTDSADLKSAQIVENLHRENLGLAETCAGVRDMLAMVGKPAEVGRRLSKSAAWVSKHLSVTGPAFTPEVRELVNAGQCNDLETALMLNQVIKHPECTEALAANVIAQVRNGLIGRARVRAELERLKAGPDDGEGGGEGEGEGGEEGDGNANPTGKHTVTFDLSAEQYAQFEALGGVAWLKKTMKHIKAAEDYAAREKAKQSDLPI